MHDLFGSLWPLSVGEDSRIMSDVGVFVDSQLKAVAGLFPLRAILI